MLRPVLATLLGVLAVGGALFTWWVALTVPGSAGFATDAIFSVIGLITVAVGLTVAWRVRDNVTGVLLVIVGTLQVALAARGAWYWIGYAAPHILPPPTPLVLALNNNLGAVCFVAVALTVLYFPTGRLPAPRWRWLIAALVASSIALVAAGVVSDTPNFEPYQDQPPLVTDPTTAQIVFSVVAAAVFLIVIVITIAAALLRVRRASGVLRAQLQWALLGSCLFLFYPVVCGSEILLTGEPREVSLAVAYLGMLSLPLGVGVGMLRHDLFDVDRAVASAVGWAIVVSVIALVFAALITVGGVLFGSGSPWITAAATAACAVVLIPLQRVIRRGVDRRLYPVRRSALAAVTAVEARVNAGVGAPEEIEDQLRDALHYAEVRVGFVIPESGEIVDAAGIPVRDTGATPIEAGGELIGVLVAPALSPGLRREVAAASVMLVNVARLRMHLSRSIAEIAASRSRIVAAEDDARRRFERDLHDGAQQRLVSLGMTLRLAQRRLPSGDVDVEDLLDGAVAQLSTATAELRRLAHGIRPSVLDDGLVAAVESLSRLAPVPVSLQMEDVVVPEPAATTAYFVVAESLANAVKHAAADRIDVRLSRVPAGIRVSVTDDGCGGADAADGTGIAGLRDRVSAIGGRLLLVSDRGRGTTIEVELPCAS